MKRGKLPNWLLVLHIVGKFLFGIGIGMIALSYLTEYQWQWYGVILAAVGFLVHLPRIWFKK